MIPGPVVHGDEGTRTPNPRLAKAVLYHLSYVPATSRRCGEANTQRVEVASRQRAASACAFLRLRTTTNAPAANATSTTDLSTGHLHSTCGLGRGSPTGRFYEPPDIRQTQSARRREQARAPAHLNRLWAWEDLNLRPHPYQGCALTD